MKTFDLNKPFQTKNGRKVKILSFNANKEYPIVGYIEWKDNYSNVPRCWDKNGCIAEGNLDFYLVNTPQIVPLERSDLQGKKLLFRHVTPITARTVYDSYISLNSINCPSYDDLQKHYEYSDDGGKTWKKCEKTID